MSELIPLNIVIADRTYRIKALPKDEESIRKTVKFINDKVVDFKTNFAGKDMQDYLSMVVIWYATNLNETGKLPETEMQTLMNALSTMEKSVDSCLGQ